MRPRQIWLVVLVVLGLTLCSISCGKEAKDRGGTDKGQAPGAAAADSASANLLVGHLRTHFDDLHDVTMRFHHKDPTINGMIEIKTTWENSRLKSAETIRNETGSDDLADALIEKLKTWEIEGLIGPFETVIPINVKIVGLDDPKFADCGILTGEVLDEEGSPLQGVMVVIKPEVAGMVYRAETNREGIFVRTLIPPGAWDVEYSLQGYETLTHEGVRLSAGKHVRESAVLKKM
jgi:hypothetical protein